MADVQMQETFDLPESSNRDRELQEKLLREFELRRKIRQVVVPTDDGKVRQLLRQLAEPITLFGEREMERRERLKKVLAQKEGQIDFELPTAANQLLVDEQPQQTELFYTEGSEELKSVRYAFAQFSLRKAHDRIQTAKQQRDDTTLQRDSCDKASLAAERIKTLNQQSSQLGGDGTARPISCCEFSPNSALLATCDWGGIVSLWSSATSAKSLSVRAHEERCTGLAWHPAATVSQTAESVNFATGSADNTAKLFSATGRVLRTLEGHTDRLARVAFHPYGKHLGTASYDQTWRLWDVETGSCVLEQEGHSRAVYAVAFHPDGSLAGSGGLDAYGRIWDCRTGRSVLVLEGHVKQLLAMDFSPNGHHVVTGSSDNSCKVWDLRKKGCIYTIPAHRNLVSSVKFERSSGSYLLSGSYDYLAKVWSAKDFSLLKTLAGHDNKVMGVDVASDGSHTVATVSYDRTIKFWAPEDPPADLMEVEA